jgi:hypothetical protein
MPVSNGVPMKPGEVMSPPPDDPGPRRLYLRQLRQLFELRKITMVEPAAIPERNLTRRNPSMGAQKVKGKFIAPNFSQGGAALGFADVLVANAEIKALRATPKVLVPAPGAGRVLEFQSAVLQLKAGANILTETTANLAVKYKDGTGVQVSQTIEATGFVDQAADQITYGLVKLDPITSRVGCENQALVLHNLGAGKIAGNAANDALLRVKAQTTGTAVMTLTYDTNNSFQITWQKMAFATVEITETDQFATVAVECTPIYDATNGLLTAVAKCNIDAICQ